MVSRGTGMTVHHAGVLAFAAVLIGISAVGPFEACIAAEQPLEDSGALAEHNDPSKRQELLTQIRKLKQKRSAMLRNFSGAKRNLMPRSYKPGGTTIYKRTTFISTPMGGQPKKR